MDKVTIECPHCHKQLEVVLTVTAAEGAAPEAEETIPVTLQGPAANAPPPGELVEFPQDTQSESQGPG